MNRYKYLLIGFTVALVVAFAGGAYLYKKRESDKNAELAQKHAEALQRSYSPSEGPENAPVTIVEFLDPECEACRAFYPAVKKVMAQFDGKVRLVVRHLPFHKNSAYAIRMLYGAQKQGKYWETLEVMFENQPKWADHHTPKPELLMGYMQSIGLDIERLKTSMEDSEAESRVRQDHDDGIKLGVDRTPSFFVDGKKVEQLGYDQLLAAVAAAVTSK